MAKSPTSVVGVDLGRYSMKSVLMQRRGTGRFVVTHFATRPYSQVPETPEILSSELKALFKSMGGSARVCAVGVSSADALIRIIEQPETPPRVLRDALRLHGMSLLNQDCREYVLDCDHIDASDLTGDSLGTKQHRYLIGGLPRSQVRHVSEAFSKTGHTIGKLQLAPLCVFNAFEFAQPELFNNEAFMLVDVGHASSTMMIGLKRELVLVRSIDFGAHAIIDMLMGLTGESRERITSALEQEDELMVENSRMIVSALTREISSSIGYFEGRREQTVRNVFISGAAAKSRTLIKVMGEELGLPCQPWSVAEKCEINISSRLRDQFAADSQDFHVACGAALEALTPEYAAAS